MKTPSDIVEAVTNRLAATWHDDIAATDVTYTWPFTITLGSPTKADLEANFAAYQRQTFTWQEWALVHWCPLMTAVRRVQGTDQPIPTHVTIPDMITAINLAEGDWPARIERGRLRLSTLRRQFPDAEADLPKVVRTVVDYSDTDFTLLCDAAAWFQTESAAGKTARQVPIEGLHSKWLNTHRRHVLTLAGRDTLGLIDRPQRVHFTYLDPDHHNAGGRRHDSVTVGDAMLPAYRPEIVLITENKDTAIYFELTPGAIAVEGAGFTGAPGIASIDWIRNARHIIYWGDIDAEGYEIVNRFRRASVQVRTMLMDRVTYEHYERFGTWTDARGNPLPVSKHKTLDTLTPGEGWLYDALTDPDWPRVRRIEQERIPLPLAAEALTNAL